MTENLTKYTVTEKILPDGTPYITVTGVYPIDASATFECGQCFRFDRTDARFPELYGTRTAYAGVAYGRYIRVMTPDPDTLIIENATEADFHSVWLRYFCLDIDYASIIDAIDKKWGTDSRLSRAAHAGEGIRILAQDPWEALISFIISQNNNIPRIKSIINRLCREYGDPVNGTDSVEYSFPSPRRLFEAGTEGLFALKMGFRAKYVFDASERVMFDSRFLPSVADAETYTDAEATLTSVKGVGAKVAACTLLFGFRRLDSFPVDVWIRRTSGKYFECGIPQSEDFGTLAPYAGIIQQYIFHYERNCDGD